MAGWTFRGIHGRVRDSALFMAEGFYSLLMTDRPRLGPELRYRESSFAASCHPNFSFHGNHIPEGPKRDVQASRASGDRLLKNKKQ